MRTVTLMVFKINLNYTITAFVKNWYNHGEAHISRNRYKQSRMEQMSSCTVDISLSGVRFLHNAIT